MFSETLRNRLKHVHAFAVTPFKKDNLSLIDVEGLQRNLTFLLEKGVQVICVGGGTGEVNALTETELLILAETGLDVVGDRAILLPSLPGNLGLALQLAPQYEKMGAKVALVMAPFIRDSVPSDLDGVFHYYRIISEATGMALIPYNTQEWPSNFFVRLAEIEQLIAIKDPCAAPHNLFRAIQLLGDRFVWIGNKRHDPGVLHYRYQAGIDGFSAGLVNFVPQYLLELHACALKKDWARMIEIQALLAPLEQLRMNYGETAIKTSMDLLGLSGGPVRPPRLDIDKGGREIIRNALIDLGLNVN